MSLYPQFEFEAQPNHIYTLPPSNLGFFPITLPEGGKITVIMQQLMPDPYFKPQDHSVRGWISQLPGANPVVNNPLPISSWTLSRYSAYVVNILAPGVSAPPVGYPLSLTPGDYWLNLLNLANERNSISFRFV